MLLLLKLNTTFFIGVRRIEWTNAVSSPGSLLLYHVGLLFVLIFEIIITIIILLHFPFPINTTNTMLLQTTP